MTSTLDIVTRAFRKLGISGTGDTLTAEEIAEGVAALNDMLYSWKLAGVDLEHTNLAPTDAFPLDPEYNAGVIYMLARQISPDFVTPATFDADDWFRNIQAAYMVIAPATFPRALRKMPSVYMRGTRGGRLR